MKQFNQIAYNKDTKTLDVGAGVKWGNVYKFLNTLDSKLGVVGASGKRGLDLEKPRQL